MLDGSCPWDKPLFPLYIQVTLNDCPQTFFVCGLYLMWALYLAWTLKPLEWRQKRSPWSFRASGPNLRNMDVNKISWIEMVCVSNQGHCQSLGTLSVPQTFVCLQCRCSKVDRPTQLIFILVFYSCKLTQCPCPCLFGGGWVMMGFRQCRRQCCMSPTRPERRITQCRCKYPLLPENLTPMKRNPDKIFIRIEIKITLWCKY